MLIHSLLILGLIQIYYSLIVRIRYQRKDAWNCVSFGG